MTRQRQKYRAIQTNQKKVLEFRELCRTRPKHLAELLNTLTSNDSVEPELTSQSQPALF